MGDDWRNDLEAWLAPFVGALRHKAPEQMCPFYVAVIGPGDRKSVHPMAARDDAVSYDQLHHFVASGLRDTEPLEAALLAEADAQVVCDDARLIIDDTALPKKGTHRSEWPQCLCSRQERHPCLRHSIASHVAAHSETLPMTGKLLGHADVRATTRSILTMTM